MNDQLKAILEVLIFLSQEPLTLDRIKEVLGEVPEEELQATLAALRADFNQESHGIEIIQSAGGYLFTTKPDHDQWVRRLLQIEKKSRLSSAALETLSVIAYHQPITQAEVSAIRGVDSTYSIKNLLQKKLIKIVGRKKAPGNPLVYRTSEKFLEYFGLNSLDDLPKEEEIAKILEEEKQTIS
ncbi:MAG TPA: SMC-Scp complex subunit ScpB [Candidatus Saccharicenans sp.]|nr:SMC-Scp complex subunit ScpB [Candidatus Saccharicenans sp.]HOL45168.1 SMC-Scp complex subunit ScpB [Candidatus Saccharicenans sp.]HOM94117.1 SMC-Scp complex subunit ScpB [Candidatus Saccharicenans sp.]HOT68560.1 SMC-Scp complex subunit ScpB [Candidatus Saccharicenans sp.]HPC88202.1 SMC-Scp complex subunit ScpB [Candidatus Saccharicenans sp.]